MTPSASGQNTTLKWRRRLIQLIQFGLVGAVAFVVDAGGSNLLVFGPGQLLAHKPVTAKVISGVASILVAWVGNRYWAFSGSRREQKYRELVCFFVVNLIGVGISAGCLYFTQYVLDMDSALSYNISANIVGTGLGTIFRYGAYRFWVFPENK